MKKGKFIVLDGGEGAGKSSQIQKIKKHFGDSVVVTREPGGSPYAEEIRNVILKSTFAFQADAKTHFALFWAARADHLKNTIIPALLSGKHVICDRFDSSTYAYQIHAQEHIELKEVFFKIRDFYLGEFVPDLYVLMDVDVKEGLRRKQKGAQDDLNHFDEREVDFHLRQRIGLIEFYTHVPNQTIDANQSEEKVLADLIKMLTPLVS